MISGADNAVAFHLLDDGGSPIIADLQMSLNKACRGFLLADHQLHRLIIEAVAAKKIAGADGKISCSDFVDEAVPSWKTLHDVMFKTQGLAKSA